MTTVACSRVLADRPASLHACMGAGVRPVSVATSVGTAAGHNPLPPLDPSPRQRRCDLAIARAKRFIAAHLGDHLELSDIAAAACMSRFHFARTFRQCTGSSPMEYVQYARIERAMELLRGPAGTLSTVATELGFFDQSHFTRSFRRATGATPGAYARMHAGRPHDGASVHASAHASSSTGSAIRIERHIRDGNSTQMQSGPAAR